MRGMFFKSFSWGCKAISSRTCLARSLESLGNMSDRAVGLGPPVRVEGLGLRAGQQASTGSIHVWGWIKLVWVPSKAHAARTHQFGYAGGTYMSIFQMLLVCGNFFPLFAGSVFGLSGAGGVTFLETLLVTPPRNPPISKEYAVGRLGTVQRLAFTQAIDE